MWSLSSFLTVLNFFCYLVKLLTIKCFQDKSSLIISSKSHRKFYLLCRVLIYKDIRKNMFLCCTPDAFSIFFIKAVISDFSSILLVIFLLISVVHCRYYIQRVSYFQKELSLWCESSEHKPQTADFGCNSTYTTATFLKEEQQAHSTHKECCRPNRGSRLHPAKGRFFSYLFLTFIMIQFSGKKENESSEPSYTLKQDLF